MQVWFFLHYNLNVTQDKFCFMIESDLEMLIEWFKAILNQRERFKRIETDEQNEKTKGFCAKNI